MSIIQMFITIAVVVLGTVLTRFLPYMVFTEGREIPMTVKYLGKFWRLLYSVFWSFIA